MAFYASDWDIYTPQLYHKIPSHVNHENLLVDYELS